MSQSDSILVQNIIESKAVTNDIYKPKANYFINILIIVIGSISSIKCLILHVLSHHKPQCQGGDDHLVINGGLLL